MIDFACKQFDLKEIIKCSLSLTKSEYLIMEFIIKNKEEFSTNEISKKLDLDITTIQKAMKKLYDKKIVLRHQKNLDNGGYVYTYEASNKKEIREIIKYIIENWSNKVKESVDKW